MRTMMIMLALLILVPSPFQGEGRGEGENLQVQENIRFATVEVFIDSNSVPLAAWQFDFRATTGDIAIVGLEGGNHSAFTNPPYYDPRAIQGEHVIAASFSTADAAELPTGKNRVATIHLMIRGDAQPQYDVKLTAAADTDGQRIDATISIQEGATP